MEEERKNTKKVFHNIFFFIDLYMIIHGMLQEIQSGDKTLLILALILSVCMIIGMHKDLGKGCIFFIIIICLLVMYLVKPAKSVEEQNNTATYSADEEEAVKPAQEEIEEPIIEEDEEEYEEEESNSEDDEKKQEEDRIEKEKEAAQEKEDEYRNKYEENANYIAEQLPESGLNFSDAGILQQTFSGQLEEYNTVNQYVLNYDRNVPVWMVFKHSNLTEDRYGWKIELADSNGNLLDRFYSRWNKEEEYSNVSGVAPGQYIVTVSAGSIHSDAPYTLDVYYADMDNYEREPNDEALTANEMIFNSENGVATNYGSLNFDDDKDFYTFSLPASGHIAFKFEHLNQTEDRTGWKITLWNKQSEQLFSFYSNWNKESSFSFNEGLPEGKYYAIVEREDRWNVTPYAISVVYREADNWETEFNDTISEADIINSSIPYYGTLHNYDDKDYYRFICVESGEYEIEFSHEIIEGSAKWYIEVLDSDSNVLENGALYSCENESENYLNLQFEEGEEYYILVKGEGNYSDEDYSIIIRK